MERKNNSKLILFFVFFLFSFCVLFCGLILCDAIWCTLCSCVDRKLTWAMNLIFRFQLVPSVNGIYKPSVEWLNFKFDLCESFWQNYSSSLVYHTERTERKDFQLKKEEEWNVSDKCQWMFWLEFVTNCGTHNLFSACETLQIDSRLFYCKTYAWFQLLQTFSFNSNERTMATTTTTTQLQLNALTEWNVIAFCQTDIRTTESLQHCTSTMHKHIVQRTMN